MRKALDVFESGPVKIETPHVPNQNSSIPPEDVRIALVTSKVLGGYESVDGRRTDIHAASLGRDHLWIRPDEASSLVQGEIRASLTRRIVRYHFVDNTRGEPPFWRVNEIVKADLTLNEGQLLGRVKLQTADAKQAFAADVYGVVESKDGKLSRFDVVVKGAYRGEGRYTHGAPPGDFPFAVSLRLIEPNSAFDRVIPGAARGNVRRYLN